MERTLKILNPWWRSGKISKDLAKPFKRPWYYKARTLMKERQILVLTGLRRVGKTTIMYQLIEDLLKRVKPERILYHNFDRKAPSIIDILDTYRDLTGIDWETERVYLFLDEIVKLENWVSELKLIYDSHPNLKIVISSSSSFRMEEQASKNLAGRYFILNVKPLNFTEYLKMKGKGEYLKKPKLHKAELENEFREYLIKNFPETVHMKRERAIEYYDSLVTQKVIKRDVVEEFSHADVSLLETLIRLFYSEPGTYISYDSLSKSLGISKKTLIQHVRYLTRAYLIKIVRNFRPGTMSSSRKMQRVYPYWWSLAYPYDPSSDKIMEAFVSSYLDANHYWRKGGSEVDFILVKKREIVPVEVKNKKMITLSDSKNLRRFMEKYGCKKSVLISWDKTKLENGVLHLNFIELALTPEIVWN